MEEENIEPISKVFSRNLINLRRLNGLTQKDLAELSGISRSAIGFYELGTIPPSERLDILAKTLHVPVAKFFEQSDGITQSKKLQPFISRNLKRFEEIQLLDQEDRNNLYRMLDVMIEKKQLKRFKEIQLLDQEDRNNLYRMLDVMIEKKQLKITYVAAKDSITKLIKLSDDVKINSNADEHIKGGILYFYGQTVDDYTHNIQLHFKFDGYTPKIPHYLEVTVTLNIIPDTDIKILLNNEHINDSDNEELVIKSDIISCSDYSSGLEIVKYKSIPVEVL